jgi:DNA-binding PadR family transcriptional regulator
MATRPKMTIDRSTISPWPMASRLSSVNVYVIINLCAEGYTEDFMSIETAILGLLSLRPLTGYDLKKVFEGSAELHWSGNNNQIYRTLVALHKENLVSMEVHHQDKGPSSKRYTITEKGLDELRRRVLAAPELPQLRHPFLIQLAWADVLTGAELDALLGRYEEEALAQLAMLRAKQRPGASPSSTARGEYVDVSRARTPREARLWDTIQRNWQALYERELAWVQALRRDLAGEAAQQAAKKED